MPTYRLAKDAIEDVVAILREGIDYFGYDQAASYRAGLDSAFEMIATFPKIARVREETGYLVRALPFKSHLIIYELGRDDEVVILRVRHGREDWIDNPL